MTEKVYVAKYKNEIIGVYSEKMKAHEGCVMHSMYYDIPETSYYEVEAKKFFD